MSGSRLPTTPEQLTVEKLNEVIATVDPSALLDGFEVLESHVYGSGVVSTASRIVIAPRWRTPSADLPTSVVMKIAHREPEDSSEPGLPPAAARALYENEAAIYLKLRPWEVCEAPRAFGAAYDDASITQLIILEDLRERGATFPAVTAEVPLAQVESLVDELAALHARYWNSPELGTSLSWMQHHTRGTIYDMFSSPQGVIHGVTHEVEAVQFKREMVQRMGQTTHSLFGQFMRLQRHQARLPQTVCHGDTHIANTYRLPGNKAGLLDWQLSSIGFGMHDLSYFLATSQSVADRRRNEHDQLARYRERLLQHGAKDVPSAGQLWLEYRRAMAWGVFIGWLPTPVVNYGWEVNVMAHLRVMTAYEDCETAAALADLDD
ncbi:MAG TPA: phosphotransferase [Novosphingobium sp.]|nr:phosphotransferase [Novosphingobium sp.]